MAEPRMILLGAEAPLPPDHHWHEGDGWAVYAAHQPRSTWREHSHAEAQVTIGLHPAQMHAEWRTGARTAARRELSGNLVAVVPPREPHTTFWQRRAALVQVYLSVAFLGQSAAGLGWSACPALRPAYLVRDPLIEELGRALYRECRAGAMSSFGGAAAVVLARHLLRTYSALNAPLEVGLPRPGSGACVSTSRGT